MNKKIPILLAVLVLLSGVCLIACGPRPVEIPDHDLNVMIRNAIEKPEGNIYPWELEELKTLKAGKMELWTTRHTIGDIFDLTGLEYCVNLQYLDLNTNPITDITPLASLTKLRTLILNNAGITDISPLASLSLLETLNLANNQIMDISALASVTSLRELYLFNNKISDISALSMLNNLEVLLLGPIWEFRFSMDPILILPGSSNRVSDLSPLQDLVSLKYLNVGANVISDIKPISNLVNLKILSLFSNYITDIYPLVSLVKLNELNLFANEIEDVHPLLSLINLKKLNLFGSSREYIDKNREVLVNLMDKGVEFSLDEDSPP